MLTACGTSTDSSTLRSKGSEELCDLLAGESWGL
jgi:hypothetical protein